LRNRRPSRSASETGPFVARLHCGKRLTKNRREETSSIKRPRTVRAWVRRGSQRATSYPTKAPELISGQIHWSSRPTHEQEMSSCDIDYLTLAFSSPCVALCAITRGADPMRWWPTGSIATASPHGDGEGVYCGPPTVVATQRQVECNPPHRQKTPRTSVRTTFRRRPFPFETWTYDRGTEHVWFHGDIPGFVDGDGSVRIHEHSTIPGH